MIASDILATPPAACLCSAWNSGRADPIILPSYDTDGNPAAFSDAEMSNIVQIWRYVAEDYAAWDLDITTIEPVPYDASKHLRVVIGGDNAWVSGWIRGGGACLSPGALLHSPSP